MFSKLLSRKWFLPSLLQFLCRILLPFKKNSLLIHWNKRVLEVGRKKNIFSFQIMTISQGSLPQVIKTQKPKCTPGLLFKCISNEVHKYLISEEFEPLEICRFWTFWVSFPIKRWNLKYQPNSAGGTCSPLARSMIKSKWIVNPMA